ncbi:MAG: hypothetical protein J7M38_03180 [Armatimonadetes bacterium]|nr:hypothetical protein [Armatimonadota bacterium]
MLFMTAALLVLCASTVLAQDHEALPYGDLEYMADRPAGGEALIVWARAGSDHPSLVGWNVSTEAPASGKVYIRNVDPACEFFLAGEGGGGEITGSVMLRAAAPTQATIRLSWYNRFKRTDETKSVDVTSDWQRFEITMSADRGGPLELGVKPAAETTIYADDFSIVCPGPPGNENVEDPTPISHEPVQLAPLQDYDGDATGRSGSVELTISIPEGAEPIVPYVWGGIPFPKGEVYDRRCLRVTDARGRPVAAQFDVLSRWHGDSSLQAVLVTVPVGAGPRLRLTWMPEAGPAGEPDVPTGRLAELDTALQPIVTALDGARFTGDELEWNVTERSGPLCTVVCKRRRFGPITVETRVTVFADSPRALVDCCFINEGGRVAVRELGMRFSAGDEPFRRMLHWREKEFTSAGSGAGGTHRTTLLERDSGRVGMSLRDQHGNHYILDVSRDGPVAWGWCADPPQKAVVLSQGLARTLSFMVDLDAKGVPPEYATAKLPLLTAPAEWYCNSGVFGFLMPPDPKTFPIFESTLGSFNTLGRFSWEQKESRKLYGWFNFGDAPGDGGWSNLETEADHEIFLHWFRTLSREHFDNARLAAEHYRDVDIDHRFGYCHTHCNNHTSSGESWSHSWIQGIRDLYFLTGDGRSLAVLREVGERLLSKEPGFTTGRDWTRPIDNLVDIYQTTGDRRYLDAVLAHVKVLGERQQPDTGVCGAENGSWYHNRYEAGSAFTWYGCLAMAKLHQNVGGDELRDIFLRELDLSLDVQTKGRAAYVYLPDQEISEDERALVIGRYTLGRGSVLFPAIGYAYRLTGDEKYLRIGMDVLAHCLLNQRSGSDNSATSFITAFLREAKAAGWGPKQEAEAFARAREYSWAKHPRELVNGGFEQDAFAGWNIKKVPGQDFYRDPIVNVGYYLDSEVKLAGGRSLRIHSDNRGRVISCTTQVALPAGHRWRAGVWVRADETMNPTASYRLHSYEGLKNSGGSLRATGEERDGWHERAAEFITVGRMVLTIQVGNNRGTGDVWFDEVTLEDLGELGILLTENGVGHEGREPAEGLYILTGGTYLPDQPMTGDVDKEGPILFTEGALTDGDDGYDYSRKPCSYAYWQRREFGEVLFDLKAEYRIDRVTLKVNCDSSRRAHGTSKIELLPADSDEPIAVIEQAADGWNSFEDLDLTARKVRLRLHRLDNRTYITIAEVEIWGKRPE